MRCVKQFIPFRLCLQAFQSFCIGVQVVRLSAGSFVILLMFTTGWLLGQGRAISSKTNITRACDSLPGLIATFQHLLGTVLHLQKNIPCPITGCYVWVSSSSKEYITKSTFHALKHKSPGWNLTSTSAGGVFTAEGSLTEHPQCLCCRVK